MNKSVSKPVQGKAQFVKTFATIPDVLVRPNVFAETICPPMLKRLGIPAILVTPVYVQAEKKWLGVMEFVDFGKDWKLGSTCRVNADPRINDSVERLFLFDVLTGNCDRSPSNFGWRESQDRLELLAFDHQLALLDPSFASTASYYFNFTEPCKDIAATATRFGKWPSQSFLRCSHSNRIYKALYDRLRPRLCQEFRADFIALLDDKLFQNSWESIAHHLSTGNVRIEADRIMTLLRMRLDALFLLVGIPRD